MSHLETSESRSGSRERSAGKPDSPPEARTRLVRRVQQLVVERVPIHAPEIYRLCIELIQSADDRASEEVRSALAAGCAYLFEIGRSKESIEIGEAAVAKVTSNDNIQFRRKLHNMLGGQYCDIADFTSSMRCLEIALGLARQIGDPVIEAICTANVVAVMQEMGHYRQSIALARTVIVLDNDSATANGLKIQCASNGLFSAHRIGDRDSASYFLEQGQRYLPFAITELNRAFFEKNRAIYLIDEGQAQRAKALVDHAVVAIGSSENARVRLLLGISRALCDWSVGEKSQAREVLFAMYEKTRKSRLYHHFVLQALVKVYSDSSNATEAGTGLQYARELVEYTTSVKKAKFYRQLSSKRTASEDRATLALTSTNVDPFGTARDWLTTTDIRLPGEEAPTGRRELAKHEELTAIHEDMARLRAATLRRDMRTDAVDTAENWAIAAEFFDDETGQHCYRVGHLASMLARQIGMDETFCMRVEHAARLHDIGKIAVNEVILLKPGPLDASEMAAMRLHTEVGAQILAGSDDPVLKMAVDIARHHHEWWNGAGYPKRLADRRIPLSARICAFADVYDALTHARAYKKAWSHERALEEIQRLKGIQFDPELMKPFTKVLDRYLGDLESKAIPGFADMDSNALIATRKKLMETIAAGSR